LYYRITEEEKQQKELWLFEKERDSTRDGSV
jgi:hypothetical protein